MRSREDANWDLIGSMLAAESSGKAPRMFASRRTLFGIPSALDQELESLEKQNLKVAAQLSDDDDSRPCSECAGRGVGSSAKGRKGEPQHVVHPLEPVYDERSRVLILGTMPSPKSRETGFYYNHPQNRFWPVISALFDEPLPQTNDEKRALVLRHGIALWDVLAECTIEGASDGTIAQCVPNDIEWLLSRVPIRSVFCTGAKAAELYGKYCEPQTGVACVKLPSTSSANASYSLDALIEAYRPICKL